jgi:hypothetical protein
MAPKCILVIEDNTDYEVLLASVLAHADGTVMESACTLSGALDALGIGPRSVRDQRQRSTPDPNGREKAGRLASSAFPRVSRAARPRRADVKRARGGREAPVDSVKLRRAPARLAPVGS